MHVCLSVKKRSADRALEGGTYGNNNADDATASSSKQARDRKWWQLKKGGTNKDGEAGSSGAYPPSEPTEPSGGGTGNNIGGIGGGEAEKSDQGPGETGWKWEGWRSRPYGMW